MSKLYIPTPISEPPKKKGWYACLVNGEPYSVLMYSKQNDCWYTTANITHYLRPVEGNVLTDEELEAVASKAWRAGSNRGYTECLMESGEMHDNPYPDKDTYLKSIKK